MKLCDLPGKGGAPGIAIGGVDNEMDGGLSAHGLLLSGGLLPLTVLIKGMGAAEKKNCGIQTGLPCRCGWKLQQSFWNSR